MVSNPKHLPYVFPAKRDASRAAGVPVPEVFDESHHVSTIPDKYKVFGPGYKDMLKIRRSFPWQTPHDFRPVTEQREQLVKMMNRLHTRFNSGGKLPFRNRDVWRWNKLLAKAKRWGLVKDEGKKGGKKHMIHVPVQA